MLTHRLSERISSVVSVTACGTPFGWKIGWRGGFKGGMFGADLVSLSAENRDVNLEAGARAWKQASAAVPQPARLS